MRASDGKHGNGRQKEQKRQSSQLLSQARCLIAMLILGGWFVNANARLELTAPAVLRRT
jgi:hypothetical protein